MENDSDLQADNHNEQRNGAVGDTNAVKLVLVLGDPPESASRRGIELEQEGDEEKEEEVGDGGGGGEDDGVVGGDMEEEREEDEIESVEAALERAKDEGVVGSLAAMELGLRVVGLEGGESRDGVEPVEEAIEGHEVVGGGGGEADGGNGGPGEKSGGGEGEGGEEEALEGEDDGFRVLDLDPFELKGGPDADEEGGMSAEEGGEEGEREGVEGGGERGEGGEEEGDLREEEGEPDADKGAGLEVEGVKDVRDHEADGEGSDDGGTAKVEEEGGAGKETDGDAGVVGERGGAGRSVGVVEGSAGGRAGIGGVRV